MEEGLNSTKDLVKPWPCLTRYLLYRPPCSPLLTISEVQKISESHVGAINDHADQERSDFDVVFTMILCGRNFCVQ